jgi:hypothetical protein
MYVLPNRLIFLIKILCKLTCLIQGRDKDKGNDIGKGINQ